MTVGRLLGSWKLACPVILALPLQVCERWASEAAQIDDFGLHSLSVKGGYASQSEVMGLFCQSSPLLIKDNVHCYPSDKDYILSFTSIKISQGLLCGEMSHLLVTAAVNTHIHTVSTVRSINTPTAS